MFSLNPAMAVFPVLLLAVPEAASVAEAEGLSALFRERTGHDQFDGSSNVAADPRGVRDVLADHDRRSRSEAKVNRHILERKGDEPRVEGTAGGGVLLIRREARGLLEVRKIPPLSGSFGEARRKEFHADRGTWNIQPAPSGSRTEIAYGLEVRENKGTPGLVTPDLLRRGSKDLMAGMRREMERRESRLEKIKEAHHGK